MKVGDFRKKLSAVPDDADIYLLSGQETFFQITDVVYLSKPENSVQIDFNLEKPNETDFEFSQSQKVIDVIGRRM